MLGYPETERADPHEEDVGRVWRDSGKIYGGRKIKHAPGHAGIVMSRRRVNRIMKAGAWRARIRGPGTGRIRPGRTTIRPRTSSAANSMATPPHTHIAANPAYVGGVGSSWACICLPGELANREIAGHAVGTRRDADLVLAAFAALRFPLGGIEVFHTDRGGGFTGERIERMLDVFGITRFLSNPGSPYDDAVVESTNRLVKKEPICDNVYTSVERLRSDANRYVWWYNHQRLHSTLGYMNPVEFTQQGVFSQVGVSCFVTDFFHCGKTLPNPPNNQ